MWSLLRWGSRGSLIFLQLQSIGGWNLDKEHTRNKQCMSLLKGLSTLPIRANPVFQKVLFLFYFSSRFDTNRNASFCQKSILSFRSSFPVSLAVFSWPHAVRRVDESEVSPGEGVECDPLSGVSRVVWTENDCRSTDHERASSGGVKCTEICRLWELRSPSFTSHAAKRFTVGLITAGSTTHKQTFSSAWTLSAALSFSHSD